MEPPCQGHRTGFPAGASGHEGKDLVLRCPAAGGQGSGEHARQRARSLLVRDMEHEGGLGASQSGHWSPLATIRGFTLGLLLATGVESWAFIWVDSHWQSSVLWRRLEEASRACGSHCGFLLREHHRLQLPRRDTGDLSGSLAGAQASVRCRGWIRGHSWKDRSSSRQPPRRPCPTPRAPAPSPPPPGPSPLSQRPAGSPSPPSPVSKFLGCRVLTGVRWGA